MQKTIDLNREVDLFSEYAEPSFSVEDNLRDKAALDRVKEIALMRQTFEEWRVCARQEQLSRQLQWFYMLKLQRNAFLILKQNLLDTKNEELQNDLTFYGSLAEREQLASLRVPLPLNE